MGNNAETHVKKKTVRKKRTLTPEQKAEKRKLFRLKIVVYAVAFVVFYALVAGIYMFISGINPFPPGEKAEEVTVKVELIAPGTEGYKNGKYNNYNITQINTTDNEPITYIKYSAIAPFVDFTVTGSSTKHCYIFTEAEEYATFTNGNNLVIVNGANVNMDAPAKVEDGEVYVPLSFIENELVGVVVAYDEKKDAYIVRKTVDIVSYKQKGGDASSSIPLTTELKKHIADLPITVDPVTPSNPGSDPTVPVTPTTLPIPDFKSDITAYEEYMNPATDEYLFLVNIDNRLESNYVPSDLVDVKDTRKDGRATQKLRKYAAMALEALFIEMRANGYTDVSVTSAYRSYSYQSSLYETAISNYMKQGYTRSQAINKVTGTMPPGGSEHQSGLCCDMHNLGAADQAFAKEKVAVWLAENAHKFGFILRYAAEKQDITGIHYEPWHFRYVGRYHATKMYESGLCLEEYMETFDR